MRQARLSRTGVKQLALLLVVVATAASGCNGSSPAGAQPRQKPSGTLVRLDLSAGLTEECLRQYVGRRVVVVGFWEPSGKLSGYVRGAERSSGKPVYVKSTTERGLEKENALYQAAAGTPVEVTGVLRLYEKVPLHNDAVQQTPTHFYFDIEEADVRFTRK